MGGGGGRHLLRLLTLVTGPGMSWSLKLSDTRVYEPHIRLVAGMREFDVEEESMWEEATSAIRAYDPVTGYGMQVQLFSSSLLLSSLELSDTTIHEP